MKRAVARIALIALSAILTQCFGGPAEPGSRGECEHCDQENGDLDCEPGLTCQGFYNSQLVVTLCATPNQSMCNTEEAAFLRTVVEPPEG